MLAEIKEATDRIQVGWRRVVRGRRLAQEYRVEGDTAIEAANADTIDGDIQAAKQRAAWTTAIGNLEGIEKRTVDQNLFLAQLRRNVRALDAAESRKHATPQSLGPQRLVAFGAVGAPQGVLSAFVGARLWMVLAAGWALTGGAVALQTARLNHAKDDLRDVRADMIQAQAERDDWRERATQYAAAVSDAREAAQQTAAALEAERRQRARAAARERERQRAIQNILTDSPEPPAWRLRDDGAIPPGSGADH